MSEGTLGTFVETLVPGGYKTLWKRYSRAEWREWWTRDGQGRQESIARGRLCVVVPAPTEELALQLCAAFNREVFAIPTCYHWDGETVSAYLGSTSSSDFIPACNRAREVWAEIWQGTYRPAHWAAYVAVEQPAWAAYVAVEQPARAAYETRLRADAIDAPHWGPLFSEDVP